MKAALYLGEKNIKVKEIEDPKINNDTVLLKINGCAICGSDIRTFNFGNKRVNTPKILGHEISGVIVDKGKNVINYEVGDRISVGADIPCNNCIYCNSNKPNNCKKNLAIGYQIEGGFAEYISLGPEVWKGGPFKRINTNIDLDLCALAEPLACCLNGYEKINKTNIKNETVLIFGAGPIGIMLGLLAKNIYKARNIIFLEKNPNRISFAKSFGFENTYIYNEHNIIDIVKGCNNKNLVDIIFTACSFVETHVQSLKILEVGGQINFFGGLPYNSQNLDLDSNVLHYKEQTLTGSHGSTPKQHAFALSLIEENKIDLSNLITKQLSLEEIQQAFQLAQNGSEGKIIIKPSIKNE